VTVAKAGAVNPSQMILRLYQPVNSALSALEVTLDPTIASMVQVERHDRRVGRYGARATVEREPQSLDDRDDRDPGPPLRDPDGCVSR